MCGCLVQNCCWSLCSCVIYELLLLVLGVVTPPVARWTLERSFCVGYNASSRLLTSEEKNTTFHISAKCIISCFTHWDLNMCFYHQPSPKQQKEKRPRHTYFKVLALASSLLQNWFENPHPLHGLVPLCFSDLLWPWLTQVSRPLTVCGPTN